MAKHHTAEEKTAIVTQYREGISVKQLAEDWKVSSMSIYAWINSGKFNGPAMIPAPSISPVLKFGTEPAPPVPTQVPITTTSLAMQLYTLIQEERAALEATIKAQALQLVEASKALRAAKQDLAHGTTQT